MVTEGKLSPAADGALCLRDIVERLSPRPDRARGDVAAGADRRRGDVAAVVVVGLSEAGNDTVRGPRVEGEAADARVGRGVDDERGPRLDDAAAALAAVRTVSTARVASALSAASAALAAR